MLEGCKNKKGGNNNEDTARMDKRNRNKETGR